MAELVETVVGRVGRAHGLRGEVAIDIHTDEPDRRFSVGARLRSEQDGRWLDVVASRWMKATLLVRFAQAGDRTAAEALRGTTVVALVDPEQSPGGENEYYDRQLVGLRVLGADGHDVGVVSEVAHLPSQDLLCIQTPGGERLVPFVAALVPQVDLAAGQLWLADVPGLIDDRAIEVRNEAGKDVGGGAAQYAD